MLIDDTELRLRDLTGHAPQGVAPLRHEVELRRHLQDRRERAAERRRRRNEARAARIRARLAAAIRAITRARIWRRSAR